MLSNTNPIRKITKMLRKLEYFDYENDNAKEFDCHIYASLIVNSLGVTGRRAVNIYMTSLNIVKALYLDQ